MAGSRICSIDDCGKPHYGRGFCLGHWQRWRRHGDPLAGKAPHGELDRFFREVVLHYDGDECLLWPYSRDGGGYGQLNRGRKKRLVHRLVCEHEHGPPPTPKHDAAHSCGRGRDGCVTRRHVRWATRVENMADTIEHGTHQFGERNRMARLSEDDVRAIRALRGKASQREIAARFGVSQPTVSMIQSGKRWSAPPSLP